MKRAILFSIVFCGLAGTLLMTEGRVYAMRVYGAPCGEATGIAGLLLKTHFLLPGACLTQGTTTACQTVGADCFVINPVSGGGNTPGKCLQISGRCSCIPIKK